MSMLLPTTFLMEASTGIVVLSSTVTFTVIILFIVFLLMLASKKLVPQGNVKILINGDESKTMEVSRGATLLSTLMDKSIILPSACGGGGTCAMCKCQILEGGGDVLPTETGHLTRAEQQDNWRLACQVKVREDMKLQVPAEIFSIKSWDCTVKSNNNVATFIKELVLDLPEGEIIDFQSGGYIQIDVPPGEYKFKDFDVEEEYRGDWDQFNLFELKTKVEETVFRAYSMANHPAEGNKIMFNIRIATPPPKMDVQPGLCSSYVFSLKPGDKCRVSGPFGEFFIKDTDREMCYIGGGAGMAPLRAHIFHLFHTLKTGRTVSYWYGARSMREVFYEDEFRAIEKEFPNFKFHLALSDALPEDNWTGPTGFIHQVVLDEYLAKHAEPEEIEYYLCGPPMMLKCVQDMLDNLGVDKEMIAFDDFGS